MVKKFLSILLCGIICIWVVSCGKTEQTEKIVDSEDGPAFNLSLDDFKEKWNAMQTDDSSKIDTWKGPYENDSNKGNGYSCELKNQIFVGAFESEDGKILSGFISSSLSPEDRSSEWESIYEDYTNKLIKILDSSLDDENIDEIKNSVNWNVILSSDEYLYNDYNQNGIKYHCGSTGEISGLIQNSIEIMPENSTMFDK